MGGGSLRSGIVIYFEIPEGGRKTVLDLSWQLWHVNTKSNIQAEPVPLLSMRELNVILGTLIS